jgi:hypothetical protein
LCLRRCASWEPRAGTDPRSADAPRDRDQLHVVARLEDLALLGGELDVVPLFEDQRALAIAAPAASVRAAASATIGRRTRTNRRAADESWLASIQAMTPRQVSAVESVPSMSETMTGPDIGRCYAASRPGARRRDPQRYGKLPIDAERGASGVDASALPLAMVSRAA